MKLSSLAYIILNGLGYKTLKTLNEGIGFTSQEFFLTLSVTKNGRLSDNVIQKQFIDNIKSTPSRLSTVFEYKSSFKYETIGLCFREMLECSGLFYRIEYDYLQDVGTAQTDKDIRDAELNHKSYTGIEIKDLIKQDIVCPVNYALEWFITKQR